LDRTSEFYPHFSFSSSNKPSGRRQQLCGVVVVVGVVKDYFEHEL